MSYRAPSKAAADKKAEQLQANNPGDKFEVRAHEGRPEFPGTCIWGVVRWTPYVPEKGMAYRFDGFVWVTDWGV